MHRSSSVELIGGVLAGAVVIGGAASLLRTDGQQRRATPGATAPRVAAASPSSSQPLRPASRRLSHPGKLARYAFVERPVTVRAAPAAQARSLGRLSTRTADGTDELVLALERRIGAGGVRWLRVRTPLPPTGTVGWVPAGDLSALRRVRTWVLVDRRALRLTLVRDGRVVLRAPVGVGTAATPTPAGGFYIRDRLTGLPEGSFYGPEAFGTSARSTRVTDWPGGSVVGIHGTSRPWQIPGRVSHGCIRLRNADIRQLGRLMPVGTPVTIR